MSGDFFDTNILVYAAGPAGLKRDTARDVLRDGGTISTQVLNELANVARRKMKLQWPDVHEILSYFRAGLSVVPLTIRTHEQGLTVAERHKLSVYDAMIVAAALEAKCDVLYSEDMHDGLWVDDRLRIVNPFG